jgi:hypothetical protein
MTKLQNLTHITLLLWTRCTVDIQDPMASLPARGLKECGKGKLLSENEVCVGAPEPAAAKAISVFNVSGEIDYSSYEHQKRSENLETLMSSVTVSHRSPKNSRGLRVIP